MAMAVDNRQQLSMGYEPMRYSAPQFTNPWVSAPATSSSQMYATSLAPPVNGLHAVSQTSSVSLPYDSLPATATLGAGVDLYEGNYEPHSSLGAASDLLNPSRAYTSSYSTSPTSAPTSAPQYAVDYTRTGGTSPYAYAQDAARRTSHPLNSHTTHAQRSSFSDALDASRGMVAMSQSDMTPRNIYGGVAPGRNSSTDSYGFPSTHSSHSSISSASTYPSYYNGSVAEGSVTGSVTDYSSAGESVEPMNSRTLPRPQALVGTSLPPAPQSMMGQFSSKVSSSSQKKHKCKICDKRFTRPSSLQTHMYSHTGEKPFACEVDGCGRHFSVVSNLRRHRKVHKGEGRDHPSPEE